VFDFSLKKIKIKQNLFNTSVLIVCGKRNLFAASSAIGSGDAAASSRKTFGGKFGQI